MRLFNSFVVQQDSFLQAGVKRNFWPLRNFWPIIVCHLFFFSEYRDKVWRLLFWCVLCKLKLFGYMSDTHNKLQYGN